MPPALISSWLALVVETVKVLVVPVRVPDVAAIA
jgi:hypothetical protein